jgi:hypothetical protein
VDETIGFMAIMPPALSERLNWSFRIEREGLLAWISQTRSLFPDLRATTSPQRLLDFLGEIPTGKSRRTLYRGIREWLDSNHV